MWLLISKIGAYLISPLSLILVLIVLAFAFFVFRRKGIALCCAGLSILYLFGFSSPYFSDYLVRKLEHQYPVIPVETVKPASIVVVLGGSINMPYGNRLEVEMSEASDRILHGFRLYQAGKARHILLAGGNIDGAIWKRSEALYLADLLQEWGVPKTDVLIEANSQTTYENGINTAAFLEETGRSGESVLLVTSAIHMPRAVAVFEAAGVKVVPMPTDISVLDVRYDGLASWLPTIGAMAAADRAMREYIGLVVYWLRGWI